MANALIAYRLTYRRANHGNFHVHGFREEGTTTTPFDMVVLNEIDRFHLVLDVLDLVPRLGSRAAYAKQHLRDKLIDHHQYVREHGEDLPEIREWTLASRRPPRIQFVMNRATITLFGGPDAFGEPTPEQLERMKASVERSLAGHGLMVEWTRDALADEAGRSKHRDAVMRAYASARDGA